MYSSHRRNKLPNDLPEYFSRLVALRLCLVCLTVSVWRRKKDRDSVPSLSFTREKERDSVFSLTPSHQNSRTHRAQTKRHQLRKVFCQNILHYNVFRLEVCDSNQNPILHRTGKCGKRGRLDASALRRLRVWIGWNSFNHFDKKMSLSPDS